MKFLENYIETTDPDFNNYIPADSTYETYKKKDDENFSRMAEEGYNNPESLFYHNDYAVNYNKEISTFDTLHESIIKGKNERDNNGTKIAEDADINCINKIMDKEFYLLASNNEAENVTEFEEYIDRGYNHYRQSEINLYGFDPFNIIEDSVQLRKYSYIHKPLIPKEFRYSKNEPHRLFLEGVIRGEYFNKTQRKNHIAKRIMMKSRYLMTVLYCLFTKSDFRPYGRAIVE